MVNVVKAIHSSARATLTEKAAAKSVVLRDTERRSFRRGRKEGRTETGRGCAAAVAVPAAASHIKDGGHFFPLFNPQSLH